MGTWGYGAFDNDAAADWIDNLSQLDPAQQLEVIAQTLRAAISADYLDADQGAEAIAAAALVADPTNAPDADRITINPSQRDALRALARDAITRVQGPESELRELHAEDDQFTQPLADLAAALGRTR